MAGLRGNAVRPVKSQNQESSSIPIALQAISLLGIAANAPAKKAVNFAHVTYRDHTAKFCTHLSSDARSAGLTVRRKTIGATCQGQMGYRIGAGNVRVSITEHTMIALKINIVSGGACVHE